LNNDTTPTETGERLGDPTEVALYEAAREAGYDKDVVASTAPRLAKLPFDSDRKCMTTFHQQAENVLAFTKGAPESVVPQCHTAINASGGPTSWQAEEVLEQAEQMAADGLRVLAIACRTWPELPPDPPPATVESDLTFLGLVGLLDPPRQEAQEAVALCQSAGTIPVMITGDHPATARAIATRLSIISDDAAVLTGQTLTDLSPEVLEERVTQVRIYARVAPEQKIRIVKALQD
jgi:Ca2+-transporting ATPase